MKNYVKKNEKNSFLELWRFIAALLIMATHMYNFGVDNYYFRETWIYVEFFLIITGFFTAKHFDGHNCDDYMLEALRYTWSKYKPLLPYTSMATVCAYSIYICKTISVSDINRVISAVGGGIADILLITDTYQAPLVLPLWYLSAMLIIFPLFCCFVQWKKRYHILYISVVYSLMYYGIRGVTGGIEAPYDFFRVMAGLMLGVFIYEINTIFDKSIGGISSLKLAVLEILVLLLVSFSICVHWPLRRLNLILLTLGGGILASGRSATARMDIKYAVFLGRLSIPVYTIHWVVGTGINILVNKGCLYNIKLEIFIYYICTLSISLIMYWFTTMIQKR